MTVKRQINDFNSLFTPKVLSSFDSQTNRDLSVAKVRVTSLGMKKPLIVYSLILIKKWWRRKQLHQTVNLKSNAVFVCSPHNLPMANYRDTSIGTECHGFESRCSAQVEYSSAGRASV